jgi:hypothetical protein
LDYLTTHTSISPIWHEFAPGFVNYKKGSTQLAAANDKVYQLLAHGRWFSPASSNTNTGRHDIAKLYDTKNLASEINNGSFHGAADLAKTFFVVDHLLLS